ncbi:hypothetical protein [Kineosporia sp. NBRC 101731]|uniref:hypothetical protein n=1 Tax=Kineosporia sp. NBRC 101731 TaxID=3032199 RepID=UPI0024A5CED2|nr:hypothetical protein [Kineosporia sp. NBRC 101731]GLY28970.1 hypothetical protein Kisp02_23350 [Kineosporia sp. NBRC 101731]
MTPLLGQVGSRLLDRWTTLIALPGVIFVAVGVLGVDLGHRHALDLAMLGDRAQAAAESATGVVVLVALAALAATGAGLGAQLLGAGQLLWWLGSWPVPLRSYAGRRTVRRRERWVQAQAEFTKALESADPQSADAAGHGTRRNAQAWAEPSRPTWIGDRVAAVETRVRNAYGLDLPAVWPGLWLVLPDPPRIEIRSARTRVDEAAVLSAWGLMYVVLGAFWWPAALIGAVTWTVGWLTARQAVDGYAALVESTVDLYGASLATTLGIPLTGALTTDVGRAITRRVRKGA